MALEIGRQRATGAARALRRWTGVEALAVFAVRPGLGWGSWRPVGAIRRKEFARDDGYRGRGRRYLLVVDATDTAKACSRRLFELTRRCAWPGGSRFR